MKDLIKEVALEGAEKFGIVADDSEIVDLVTWCVAELGKRAEAVAYLNPHGGCLVASYMPQATGLERETHTIPAFTFPPIQDIEIVGLKELLEEVQKADDALSAGDKNEALIKVRTSQVAATVVKRHVGNRKLFKALDIEAIENRVAEACIKAIKSIDDGEAPEYSHCLETLGSGEWRKYK